MTVQQAGMGMTGLGSPDRRPELYGDPPDPLSFRTEDYPAGMVWPVVTLPWGKLNYAVRGLMQTTIGGVHYLSPPHYAIWNPPDVPHACQNRDAVRYVSIYVVRELCADLPAEPCTLNLSPLIKAILADFDARRVRVPKSDADLRLAQVLVDQIRLAPRHASYLPVSDDPVLRIVLEALQRDPGDRRSLAEWARITGTTERTLSRHCQRDLGMSFAEWRQRMKLVAALSRLEEGQPVRQVALSLGYGNASAFIAMFHRLTGTTPDQMRKDGTRRDRAAA